MKYLLWLVSAAVSLAVYAFGTAIGMPQLLVVFMTFCGALTGAMLGAYFIQRRLGRDAGAPPPRGRDSGRRAR